jgi:hypothetical protein
VSSIHGLARFAANMASTYKSYLGEGLGPLSWIQQYKIPHPGKLAGQVSGPWQRLRHAVTAQRGRAMLRVQHRGCGGWWVDEMRCNATLMPWPPPPPCGLLPSCAMPRLAYARTALW